jgi:NTE family protein
VNQLGIALGAGGARGLSHIGFLKSMESHGIGFRVVSGTSIGAIIGAAYACGQLGKAEEIARSVTPASMAEWADIDFECGLFKGDAIAAILRRLTGDMTFEELRERGISLTVLACDLNTGEPVWLNKGSVAEAVRASMSIPGIFKPVSTDNRLLVDGGLVDLVPVDAARAMGASRVVAVDVYHPKDIWMRAADGLRLSVAGARELRTRLRELVVDGRQGPIRSFLSKVVQNGRKQHRESGQPDARQKWTTLTSLFRAMDVMNSWLAIESQEVVHRIEESSDVLVRPAVKRFHGHQFYWAARLIELGEIAAEQSAPAILRLVEELRPESTHRGQD